MENRIMSRMDSTITDDSIQEVIPDIKFNEIHSDEDFDDELGLPNSLTVISFEGMPVVVEKLDEPDTSLLPAERISFDVVHKRCVKFKSFNRNVLVPRLDINVTITNYERNLTTHWLNPNLYTINLSHGDFRWEITKRYKHIHHLHQQLVLFRTSLNIPFPTKTHREKRVTFRNNAVKSRSGKKKGSLPRFPKKPEVLVHFEQLPTRIKQLEDYLNNLLAIEIYRNHPETIRFLEISHLSFVYDLGIKGKEGMVQKRSGNSQAGCCNCFGCVYSMFCVRCRYMFNDLLCSSWGERWFFVKDQCFGYIDPKSGRLSSVVLFDQGFEVSSGMYSAGLRTGVQILTLSRQMVIKCWTRRRAKDWIRALKEIAYTQAKDFTQINPRRSFAPIRNNIEAMWFVDGAGYLSAVADAIESAKEEIFIADWWLSPEIYLKRPALNGDHWRLDKLLQRKAKSGVKIFILLYKEVELALGLNSYYSKQRLIADCNENIKVMRHPDHAKVGVFLWAHHEKIVVVDQTFAFMGGIDLCYGRWDDYNHRLTDLGSATPQVLNQQSLKKHNSSTPAGGTAYPMNSKPRERQNLKIKRKPKSADTPQVHDVSIQDIERKKGDSPETKRKNFLMALRKGIRSKSRDIINVVYPPNDANLDDLSKIATEKVISQIMDDFVTSLDGSAKFWIGKDYVNFIVKDFTNLEDPFNDFIDRTTTPRMPWHDVALCVQNGVAKDIARHFIERWNATKLEKARFNHSYPYLLPKSYLDCSSRKLYEWLEDSKKVTCQVLRSVSQWSCGFLEPDTVEQSIHEGYIDAITRSQHYIYIENQFFISLPHNNIYTKNQIAESLYNRIVRAHRENKVFRVYVVMPLLPGFEGEVGEPSGAPLHAITHWNYASICQGKDSLLSRLKTAGIADPTNYISFYGLRNHSILNGEPITELIYVHSKLMIVDDRILICGSANINDRSMIGTRDSEIAVYIEDETFDDGIMDGNTFPCGVFAGSLRKRLFKEHLGLLGQEDESDVLDVADPICKTFYKDTWYSIARQNTECYERVFHCLPSDKVRTFSDIKKCQEKKPLYATNEDEAQQLLDSIRGNLVLLPLKFLKEESLTPTATSVEGIMPTSLWT